jgi:hypothetical protein
VRRNSGRWCEERPEERVKGGNSRASSQNFHPVIRAGGSSEADQTQRRSELEGGLDQSAEGVEDTR